MDQVRRHALKRWTVRKAHVSMQMTVHIIGCKSLQAIFVVWVDESIDDALLEARLVSLGSRIQVPTTHEISNAFPKRTRIRLESVVSGMDDLGGPTNDLHVKQRFNVNGSWGPYLIVPRYPSPPRARHGNGPL